MSDKPKSAAGISAPRLAGTTIPPNDLAVTAGDRVLAYVMIGSRDDCEIKRCAQYIRQHVNEELAVQNASGRVGGTPYPERAGSQSESGRDA